MHYYRGLYLYYTKHDAQAVAESDLARQDSADTREGRCCANWLPTTWGRCSTYWTNAKKRWHTTISCSLKASPS